MFERMERREKPRVEGEKAKQRAQVKNKNKNKNKGGPSYLAPEDGEGLLGVVVAEEEEEEDEVKPAPAERI